MGLKNIIKDTHEHYNLYSRFGSLDEFVMGLPKSKGCIRMRNQDIIELFERVHTGEDIAIIER